MASLLKIASTAAAVVAMSTGLAFAQAKTAPLEPKFEKAKEIHGQCTGATNEDFAKIQAQLVAFTDPEVMAETLNDPEKFAALTVVINDPHAIRVMATCATEPVMWDNWMKSGTDYKKMTSAMVKVMNPTGMVKWMMAPMNPKLWAAMGEHMDANRYVKWGNALVNPTFYTPVTAMTEANWYESRLKWFASADSYAPITGMFSSLMPKQAEAPKSASTVR